MRLILSITNNRGLNLVWRGWVAQSEAPKPKIKVLTSLDTHVVALGKNTFPSPFLLLVEFSSLWL